MIRQAARDRPAEAQVICCARACTATLRSCLCCCGSYDHPSPNHAVLATSVWSFFLPMKSQEGHSHHDGRGMTQVTACMLLAVHYWCCTIFIFIFNITLLSSLTLGRFLRFYPQRSSGQAVVTGVHPSPPRYAPLFFVAHRVQHSHSLLVDFHRM